MPTTPRKIRDASGKPATITEQARRAQLITVTIDVIAAYGYAGCSLQRIADAAGITKAAVIYHFASKNAVIQAAYEDVIAALTEHMWTRLQAATSAAGMVEAYVESLIGYMGMHPGHVRVIVEALNNDTGIQDSPSSTARWTPLADLIDTAKNAGDYREDVDSQMLAIILGGAIDAVVAQSLADSTFDLNRATGAILDLLHRAASKPLLD